jgi:hypothetical protein
MNAKESVAEGQRVMLAIITAHMVDDDETASLLTVELDRQQLQNLVAVSTVQLAEAWTILAQDEGKDPAEYVRDIALNAARIEGKS